MEFLFDDFFVLIIFVLVILFVFFIIFLDFWGSLIENIILNKLVSLDLDEFNLFSNESVFVKKKDDIMSLFGLGG